ncbi:MULTISPECIES: glycosyltransferase [unclassified Paenibacillus]|uniref:glycosyltransferase n=1 Tax=unclassified Paenibacillus TaxID=185978 RepID=UPI000955A60A|nr:MULTISPECIES: glycosyltransferase [unclassified Paenibacillus]QID16115.1 glycosyltransferase [Paenibacillus sp. RUD330]SIQ81461.1 Glycosyltransferase, GT2 family [Paenibacillus sp. RU4X]SIR02926.1 Glycosyltransferase, GT2 family [Paenibacillus sp. RU4T]
MNNQDPAAHSSLSPDKGGSGAAGFAAAPVRGTVSVHIVTYNSEEDIEGCLDCVLAQSYPIEKIIVLDNASSDGTVERLRRYEAGIARERDLRADRERQAGRQGQADEGSHYGAEAAQLPSGGARARLVIIESAVNTGFAGGQNRALAEADSDYALVLNPDVRLHPDYVRGLAERLDRMPAAGSAAGMLVRQPEGGVGMPAAGASGAGGSRPAAEAPGAGGGKAAAGAPAAGPASPRRALPQAVRAWLDRLPPEAVIDSTGLSMDAARQARDRGAGEPASRWLDGGEAFGVSGAAAMYRRRMMEHVSIEGEFFDETFFAYKEDVDAAWRAELLGWKSLYAPEARALHARGWKEGGRSGISLFVRRHSYENRFYTLIKNERSLLNLPAVIAIEILKAGYIIVKERDLAPCWKTIWNRIPEMRRKRRALRLKPRRR